MKRTVLNIDWIISFFITLLRLYKQEYLYIHREMRACLRLFTYNITSKNIYVVESAQKGLWRCDYTKTCVTGGWSLLSFYNHKDLYKQERMTGEKEMKWTRNQTLEWIHVRTTQLTFAGFEHGRKTSAWGIQKGLDEREKA